MKLRNEATAELAPIHKIGTAEDGRDILQRVEGWELVLNDGTPLSEPVECDSDGNYLV